ncbi:MAG: tRNA pseudouridine(55) synthase TruB [Planctomycetota bacterium]
MARGRPNHRPDLNGVLVIDKPLRMTSARVCGIARKRTRGAKVGHAGTLDPLASGILVLCLGRATKSIEAIQATHKRYTATIDLSAFTPTDDLESEPISVELPSPPSLEAIQSILASQFTGTIQQKPPAHSAVHIEGQRAYALAREGGREGEEGMTSTMTILDKLEARPVRIDTITITQYDFPRIDLDITCGKGTYIRSIARDLGIALSAGGHLTALRRTEVGPYTEHHSIAPEDINEHPTLLEPIKP